MPVIFQIDSRRNQKINFVVCASDVLKERLFQLHKTKHTLSYTMLKNEIFFSSENFGRKNKT